MNQPTNLARIQNAVNDSINLKKQLLENSDALLFIDFVASSFFESIKKGGKILVCGNGGSAADAQHFAAELVGRFMKERTSIPSLALTTDTSVLTAIGNDYGFDKVFSRQIEGLGSNNDSLLVISTSGNSTNLLNAVQEAERKGIFTACLLGKDGGKLKDMVKYSYVVPFTESARIQEVHLMIEHIICDIIETLYVQEK